MAASPTIAGLVLAGGRGRRLAGADKALIDLCGQPMVRHVIERLAPQTGGGLLISANGDPARFAEFGVPVVADREPERLGPLAGVLAGLDWVRAHRPNVGALVSVSTDAPLVPADFVERLAHAADGAARLVIASSGQRMHPVMALWPIAFAGPIAAALAAGERRVMAIVEKLSAAIVEFPLVAATGGPVDPFFNVNTREDLARVREAICGSALPVLGIAGFKNSGKTTLVAGLVADLTKRGLRIATVKHTHHEVRDAGIPGSDTERHRAAGACAVALVAPNGWGVVPEFRPGAGEPLLGDVIAALPPCDLVIVEGYKRERLAKIEVRRAAAPAEPLSPADAAVIAIAADYAIAGAARPVFGLDDGAGLAEFVVGRFGLGAIARG